MDKDALEIEIEEKVLNPMPEYINLERKDREAFLSQVGNFSTEERGLFHLLCDNWDHEIGYAKFVTTINKKHTVEEKHLKSLMEKLRVAGCGILTTKFVRGERGVDKLILTNVLTNYFYYYFINNEYQKNYEDISNDFIQESNFDKYEITVSDLKPLKLELKHLNKKFIKNEIFKMNIYKIESDSFEKFYVTSESLQDLIKLSARKIKYYFKSDNFIAFIAKILNSSISKVRTTTSNFDISSWKTITDEVIKNEKLINSKFKNISKSFFVATIIINNYCNSELKQKDIELENDKKIKEILREVNGKIREKEFEPFSQDNFNLLFDEYNKDCPEIKAKFYETYVDNKTKTGLTEVVFIGQFYIHQDNLYKVFLDQLSLATTQLYEFYVREFRTCIFSGSSDVTLMEGLPFDNNIHSKLNNDYPILYDLFNRRGLLAESIIHFCKKRGHSQGKMHNLLSMYFLEGSNELKELSNIFNLNIVDIFEKAYSSLPGIKRFFIFIFGQYPKYIERYTGHKKIKKNKKKSSPNTSKTLDKKDLKKSYNSVIPDYPKNNKSLIKRDVHIRKNSEYNKEQMDDAWHSLGSELTKKKRT